MTRTALLLLGLIAPLGSASAGDAEITLKYSSDSRLEGTLLVIPADAGFTVAPCSTTAGDDDDPNGSIIIIGRDGPFASTTDPDDDDDTGPIIIIAPDGPFANTSDPSDGRDTDSDGVAPIAPLCTGALEWHLDPNGTATYFFNRYDSDIEVPIRFE